MSKEPKILFVNEHCEDFVFFFNEGGLAKLMNFNSSAKLASRKNPQDYNVALIDASDDLSVNGYGSLSEFLKAKNPNMLIIGTSVCGESFQKDPESKQLYDERINGLWGFPEELDEIKKNIIKYGFKFPTLENQ